MMHTRVPCAGEVAFLAADRSGTWSPLAVYSGAAAVVSVLPLSAGGAAAVVAGAAPGLACAPSCPSRRGSCGMRGWHGTGG